MNEAPITNHESPFVVHVVAAILRDAQDRILLAQRGPLGDFPGAWEFPGGKLEPGESAIAALRRELREELGVRIGASAPLIAVPQRYPHKRIVLDVHQVESFGGALHGREGQELRWAAPAELATLPMPPADRPVVAALLQPDRYLITPEPGPDDASFLEALARALAGGVRRVLLRARTLSPARLHALADAARTLARQHDCELLLGSGHVAATDVAAALGLGLHLTAAHLRGGTSRPPGLCAASCHDAEELRRAQALGCDFVVLGPVAATPTHPGSRTLGWAGFAALRELVSLPIYALGGMREGDLEIARANGAQGIAAIRALWPGPPE